MQHANSPLTPKGRHRMVLLVEEEGFRSILAEAVAEHRPLAIVSPDVAPRKLAQANG
jgi:hypothetical protein